MKQFDYQAALQTIIENKQLAEITLAGAPTYKVAYILYLNDEFITFAEISSSATFAGVYICRLDDIDSISVETVYLEELVKQIQGDTLYSDAVAALSGIDEFTFDGFMSAFEDTKTIVQITTSDDTEIAGRLAGHTSEVVVLDEYSSEMDRRIARTFFNRNIITRLAVDVPWLRTIARSLIDKNL